MAGYSGTPLPKKLGIGQGARVATLHAPDAFEATLGALPEGVVLARKLAGGRPFDVIVMFVRSRSALERGYPKAADRLTDAGGLWIAWPKRASGIATDMSEDVVREVCLPSGLVDNKVCAIDETWSGLRLVWRKALRAARSKHRSQAR